MRDLVFGYGSLAGGTAGAPARLRGFRRVWGVAMDNLETHPGYKYYRAPDGSRPDVCVAFLDLVRDQDAVVDGVLLEVDAPRLAALDARERNYERAEVTEAVEDAPAGARVWTYLGRDDSRERLRAARAEGRAVVAAAYARSVARWTAGTDPPGLDERDLERVDLPPATPDGHHVVIDGRRWRATDPSLPEDRRRELVRELMSARSAVGHAKRRGDAEAVRAARARVHAAKVALGERGPAWWEDGTAG